MLRLLRTLRDEVVSPRSYRCRRIGSLKHFWRRRAGCRRRHLGAGILVVTEAAHVYRHLGTERLRTREFRIGRNCCGTYTGKLGLGAWYYWATFDDVTRVRPDGLPVRRHGSHDLYALADWTVYQDTNEGWSAATEYWPAHAGAGRAGRGACSPRP
jgi:hypothetical protein